MLFIIKTLIIFLITLKFAGTLSILLLLGFFKGKRSLQKMTPQTWQAYFEKIGNRGLLFRMYCCYFAALVLLAALDSFLYWDGLYAYGIALIIAGIFRGLLKYRQHKENLWKMLAK